MSLKNYSLSLQRLIEKTPFVVAFNFSYEERPPSAALIRGNVFFSEGSQLDFKEFILSHPKIQVIKYAYHYRRCNEFIFRYDNAFDPLARNFLTYPGHKHLPSALRPANQPTLSEVLTEILSTIINP
jgi:hypothetical protein